MRESCLSAPDSKSATIVVGPPFCALKRNLRSWLLVDHEWAVVLVGFVKYDCRTLALLDIAALCDG